MKNLNPNPKCEGECRFAYGPAFETLANYLPLYDKHGKLITTNPNTRSGSVDCVVCGKHWTYISRYGQTKFEEWSSGHFTQIKTEK